MAKDQIFFGKRVLEEAIRSELPVQRVYVVNNAARKEIQAMLDRSIDVVTGLPRSLKNESTQGVAFEMKHEFYVDELPFDEQDFNRAILLNHLQDVQNLGAIVRSAAAFGFNLLVHEDRRSVKLNSTAIRISQGHAFHMKFMAVSNLQPILQSLRKNEFQAYALESGPASGNIYEMPVADKVALVVGSEESGISKSLAKQIDYICEIPMREGFDSLNAAQAASIAMSRFF